jgi:hypothetical protein
MEIPATFFLAFTLCVSFFTSSSATHSLQNTNISDAYRWLQQALLCANQKKRIKTTRN